MIIFFQIKGINFGGNVCDYDIQIGSSYHCPIINKTSTQLRCQITAGSMLDPTEDNIVRVARARQGYLACQKQLKFQFLPSISNIRPMIGNFFKNKDSTFQTMKYRNHFLFHIQNLSAFEKH